MWAGRKVTVVFPTYKEKNSIKKVLEEFDKVGVIDEILVVHKSAEPGTEEEILKAKMKVKPKIIHGPKQHLGYSLKKGMKEATGDYIIWAEPDSTFAGKDVLKLLVYSEDFPVVFGTRTNQSTLLEGAAMGTLRKFTNVFVAKIIEIIYNTKTLTDVGCVLRLMKRDVIKNLQNTWKTNDATFPTEVLLSVVAHKIPFVEIPVTFRPRVGESTLVPDFINTLKWGIKLTLFIFIYRFRLALKSK